MINVRVRDDLGADVERPRVVRRVVSLVPSLSEAIAFTESDTIVAATDWCTHPADLEVIRIRGTKNPDCSRIASLKPDIVIANMEENRAIDIERLRRAGLPVWVTRIESVDQAFVSMRRMFEKGLGWPIPPWLDLAEESWRQPPDSMDIAVAVPIWRDPWMVIGRDTFAGDLLARLGCRNFFAEATQRYPQVPLMEIDRSDIDLVLLPDEPYEFSTTDGPEAFTNTKVALVSGRLLTWYGPSLVYARDALTFEIARALKESDGQPSSQSSSAL
jgi:ABC-type Fe3+-hydroxamate transport system substrate-binding protein